MAVEQNIQKLRRAGIPPFTYDTTLVKENMQLLRDIVSKKEFLKDTGHVSYLLEPPATRSTSPATRKPAPRSAHVAAVLAKELVLSNVVVNFITLAGFLREVRLQDYAADHQSIMNPVLDQIGKGYLVVTEFDDVGSQPSTSVFRDGLDILTRHLAFGGGLILACNDRWTDSVEQYTPTFVASVSVFTRITT